MYFTGVKGARIHVQYLHPQKSQDKIPAVLMLHGYSWKAGEWSHKLEFVSQGFAVFALDVRGQAEKVKMQVE